MGERRKFARKLHQALYTALAEYVPPPNPPFSSLTGNPPFSQRQRPPHPHHNLHLPPRKPPNPTLAPRPLHPPPTLDPAILHRPPRALLPPLAPPHPPPLHVHPRHLRPLRGAPARQELRRAPDRGADLLAPKAAARRRRDQGVEGHRVRGAAEDAVRGQGVCDGERVWRVEGLGHDRGDGMG